MRTALVFIICAVAMLGGCGKKEQKTAVIPREILNEGDLALRRGSSLASKIVVTLDSAGTYSHVGIVARRGNEWVVVHAVPDERDDGLTDTIKADPIETFFLPSRAQAGAIVRMDIDGKLRQKAAGHALELVRRHTEFDHEYCWEDTDKLYCTQLVQLSYAAAGVDVVQGRRQRVDAPGYHGNYVFPGDVLKNDKMTVIFNF